MIIAHLTSGIIVNVSSHGNGRSLGCNCQPIYFGTFLSIHKYFCICSHRQIRMRSTFEIIGCLSLPNDCDVYQRPPNYSIIYTCYLPALVDPHWGKLCPRLQLRPRLQDERRTQDQGNGFSLYGPTSTSIKHDRKRSVHDLVIQGS